MYESSCCVLHMADGHPVALATLCENFQVVEVGDKHILQDLQRDLKQRAKMHAPLDRQLPFVRREPTQDPRRRGLADDDHFRVGLREMLLDQPCKGGLAAAWCSR